MPSDSERAAAAAPARARPGFGLLALALAVTVVVLRALEAPPAARARPGAQVPHDARALETHVPRASARRAGPPRQRTWEPPPAVERLPLGARFVERLGDGLPRTLHAARDATRAALHAEGDPVRWHHTRHPVDPRRVQVLAVHTDAQRLVRWPLPACLDEPPPAAWADASLWVLDAAELDALVPTGERREAFGHAFERHVAAGDGATGLRELWWSAELQVPLELRRRTPAGELVLRLDELRPEPDAALLRDPRAAHPDWRELDLVDWREQLAGH